MIHGMTDGVPIGVRIARRRQALGMRQEDLARKVGVSRAAVSNWEAGKHFPLRKLGAVEEVLGISLAGDDAPPSVIPGDVEAWIRYRYRHDPEYIQRALAALEDALTPRPPPSSPGEAEPRRHRAG
jgi:transcriptional regulator with XRE-family HTH domain